MTICDIIRPYPLFCKFPCFLKNKACIKEARKLLEFAEEVIYVPRIYVGKFDCSEAFLNFNSKILMKFFNLPVGNFINLIWLSEIIF